MKGRMGLRVRLDRVLVQTTDQRITGTLSVPEGYRLRLSDRLNKADSHFLCVTDAIVESRHGDEPTTEHEFMAVSLAHVVFVVPLDGSPSSFADE
jgi:hypothetical protein